MDKNHFFIISRTPKEYSTQKTECVQYFKTFKYLYDKKTKTESWGDELWFDDIKQATKFPSDNYSNCEAFLNVLEKQIMVYRYDITLYKYNRNKIIPIKTFRVI